MAYGNCDECVFCTVEIVGTVFFRYCDYEHSSVDLTPEEGCSDFEREEWEE